MHKLIWDIVPANLTTPVSIFFPFVYVYKPYKYGLECFGIVNLYLSQ